MQISTDLSGNNSYYFASVATRDLSGYIWISTSVSYKCTSSVCEIRDPEIDDSDQAFELLINLPHHEVKLVSPLAFHSKGLSLRNLEEKNTSERQMESYFLFSVFFFLLLGIEC